MGGSLRHERPGGPESHDPPPNEDAHRVVPFRPLAGLGRAIGRAAPPARPAVEDIEKYERDGGDDDYRHRMVMNVIGFFACAVLVAAGVWIANAIAEMRKTQDCVLSGRRDCARIETPTRLRW
jgi:succinylarginine dihydrolase